QYQKGYKLRQALALRDSANRDRQRNLAFARISLADLLVKQNLNDEAILHYVGAIEILDELLPKFDDQVFYSHMSIGDIRLTQGNVDEALKQYGTARSIAQTLAEHHAGDTEWRKRLARSYEKIGAILKLKPTKKQALDHYRAALEFCDRLSEESN